MGFQKFWQITSLIIIIIIVSLFFIPSVVESSNTYDSKSLNAYVLDKANKEIRNPRTGILYNVFLPANISGIEVSIIRLRTSSFRSRGFNNSFLHFPPRVIARPNVKRMAIVCSNLGNWSSLYFNVPNHTIIAPVLGFQAYVSSETTLIGAEKMKMNLSTLGDPITIWFPQIAPKEKNNEKPICAKFGENGSIKFSNMSMPYTCVTQSQGHYSLVVPIPLPEANAKRKKGIWGMVLGVVGLVILGFCFVGAFKLVKKRWVRKLERNSQRCVPFDTFWVGESKMPSASMTRTRAVLENEYVPN